MRVIWWKISRPEDLGQPVDFSGDTLTIHLPSDGSPIPILQNGESNIDRDWLTRLLNWSDGRVPTPTPTPRSDLDDSAG